ncbi:MAG: hypothetical protein WCU83_06925 [Bacteroidia bacterium]|jgi:hypothetical protein
MKPRHLFYGVRGITGIKNYWVSEGKGNTLSPLIWGVGVQAEYRFLTKYSILLELRYTGESVTDIRFIYQDKLYVAEHLHESYIQLPLFLTKDVLWKGKPLFTLQGGIALTRNTYYQYNTVISASSTISHEMYFTYLISLYRYHKLKRNSTLLFWGPEFEGNPFYSFEHPYWSRAVISSQSSSFLGNFHVKNFALFVSLGIKF